MSTSPRASASAAHWSKSTDQPATPLPLNCSRVRNGRPWVRKPEPMTSTPSSRSGRSRRPISISRSGSWVGMLICSTGTSPSGYITFSGTHAPWSSPRCGCWCTGSVSGHQGGDPRGEVTRVRGRVGHPVVGGVEAAEVVDQRGAGGGRGEAQRRRLPVRADDQDRLRLRQGLRPGEELPDPDRVVEDRRGPVAEVERGQRPVVGRPASLGPAGGDRLVEELGVRAGRNGRVQQRHGVLLPLLPPA